MSETAPTPHDAITGFWASLRLSLRNIPDFVASRRASIAVGLLCIVIGVTLMQLFTPPDNSPAKLTGTQTFKIATVPSGKGREVSLGNAPALYKKAYEMSVSLSFEMKVRKLPASAAGVHILQTGAAPNSFSINITNNGFLTDAVPLNTIGQMWPVAFGVVTPGQWVKVRVVEERNRTLEMYFGSELADSYTFNGIAWTIVPDNLVLGVAPNIAKIAFRNVQLTTTEYGSAGTPIATRTLQWLAALLMGVGTILIAQRLLRRLIPIARTSKPTLIYVVFGVAGLATLADILFLMLQHQTGLYYSTNGWLFAPLDRFADHFQTLELLQTRNPYGVQRGGYPPFGYTILYPVAWLHKYVSLFVIMSVFVGFMTWWIVRVFCTNIHRLAKLGVVVVCMVSLPMTFALDRGNTELIVLIMLLIGGAAIEQQWGWLSAAMFALSGAAKIIPIAYFLTFLRRERLKYIPLGVIVVGGVSLLSFACLHGSLSTQINGLRAALHVTQIANGNPTNSTPFNTSIAAFIQAIGFTVNGVVSAQTTTNSVQHWVGLEELIGIAIIVVFLVGFERVEWRAMTLITCGILLLPDTNGYYTLLYLFVPLALFIRSAPMNRRTIFMAVLFGLELAPRTYEFWGVGPYVDSSVLTTAPILIVLFFAVIWDNIAERRHPVAVSDAPMVLDPAVVTA